MDKARINLCVNSQTPFVRFKLGESELAEKYGEVADPVKLTSLAESEDFDLTPGGVSGMVYALLSRLAGQGYVANVDWVSLGPNAPPVVLVNDKVKLRHVYLEAEQLHHYANFKEKIYNEAHGLSRMQLKPEEYEAYVTYNWRSAKQMMKLLRETDLYYVHDFQQLFVGALLGVSAPVVFHWHIPFRPERFSPQLRNLVTRNIEAFDAMVVSTRRDLEGLIQAGYRGRAYQVYPYVDPDKWDQPSISEKARVKQELGLEEADPILLSVGRMDRIKGQDVAIKAVARIKNEFPRVRLLLVGNGSFSGSSVGGLAHPKARNWQLYLRRLISELNLRDNVTLTGHLGHGWVKCLYSLADAVLVSSYSEGFNLTTLESWLYKKPVVVSSGAGSSELVVDGANGYSFKSADDQELAERLCRILYSEDRGAGLGENGALSAKQCYVDNSLKRLREVFDTCINEYEKTRTQGRLEGQELAEVEAMQIQVP